jgi:hypothetical protein
MVAPPTDMNAQPAHSTVAFFMLTKANRYTLPAHGLAKEAADRCRVLSSSSPHFGHWNAQDDADSFYYSRAHYAQAEDPQGKARWIQMETDYLEAKLRYYYAHLGAICKAEDVYLKQSKTGWSVKFPWNRVPVTLPLCSGEPPLEELAKLALAPLITLGH